MDAIFYMALVFGPLYFGIRRDLRIRKEFEDRFYGSYR